MTAKHSLVDFIKVHIIENKQQLRKQMTFLYNSLNFIGSETFDFN